MAKQRKLEDRPEMLRDLRSLVAKALGAPEESPPVTLWERAVRRWRQSEYTRWVVLALSFLLVAWLYWQVFRG
jgi:hypothetical protein